jgi:hypothetical protein
MPATPIETTAIRPRARALDGVGRPRFAGSSVTSPQGYRQGVAFPDPGCPPEGWPCVGLFGFGQWDGSYSQGGAFRLRLTAVEGTWGGEQHTVYAMTKGADPDAHAAIEKSAGDMIIGARLPLGVGLLPGPRPGTFRVQRSSLSHALADRC